MVAEVAGGAEDPFPEATWQSETTAEVQGWYLCIPSSPRPPAASQVALILSSSQPAASHPGWCCCWAGRGFFPPREWSFHTGSCRRTTECPNRAVGLGLRKDIAPLVPKQPRCVVQGNTLQWLQDPSPWPGGGFGTAQLAWKGVGKVPSMPSSGRCFLAALTACPPSSMSHPQRCSAIPAPCLGGSRSRDSRVCQHRAQLCTS